MSRFTLTLIISSILLAVVMQGPQLLHMMDERYQGIPIHLNSDEYNYLPRVQEALDDRGQLTHELIVGDGEIQGLQPALLEEGIGRLFGWTGWSAATVLQVLDSIIPVALYLALVWFLMLCGLTRWQAVAGAGMFVILELYNLNRPIHQRMSFLIAVLAMAGCMSSLERPRDDVQHQCHPEAARRRILIVTAILLGLLPSISFWSASFAWCFSGVIALMHLKQLTQCEDRARLLKQFGFLFGIAFVVALPFVLNTLESMQHPLYSEVQYRSGIYTSREPQSLIWSVLFLGMSLGTLWVFMKDKVVRTRNYGLLALLLTALICLNQQIVHGTVVFFASHYLFGLVIAAVACVVFSFRHRPRSIGSILAGACATVFLLGIAFDGRAIINQWTKRDSRFAEQHLASTLEVLRKLPRQRILSDRDSMNFIASHTHHDVPYWVYLKNALISDQEFAERYCLSLLPLTQEQMEAVTFTEPWLLYFEVREQTPALRSREVALVRDVCRDLMADPEAALAKHQIGLLFWDEEGQPEWDPANLGLNLEKLAIGKGWSLWKIL